MHFINVPIHVGISGGNLLGLNIIKLPSLSFPNISMYLACLHKLSYYLYCHVLCAVYFILLLLCWGQEILKSFHLNYALISLLYSCGRVPLLVTLEKCLQTGN